MINSGKFQECIRCIMNTEADTCISFNDAGLCHHCSRYDVMSEGRVATIDTEQSALTALVERVKKDGKGNEYDCIVGISGGVDSTYVAYLLKSLGLRPLAVHLDNGWNSELAIVNIEKTLKKLEHYLYEI